MALTHGWNCCWQVLRVYVLSRVTIKAVKTLLSYPGMEGCQLPPDTALVNGNVYSSAETVLLAWTTSHYYRVQCYSFSCNTHLPLCSGGPDYITLLQGVVLH